MKKYLLLGLLGILLFSCDKQGKKAITETQDLAAFHSVELNDVFDVSLMEDTAFFIEIVGSPKMVAGVEVRVEDSVLYLDRKNGNRWYRPQSNEVQVIIHSAPLNLVTANKACYVGTINPITSYEFGLVFKDKASHGSVELNCNSFYFWNNEPTGGFLRVRGQSNFLKIWNASIMTVDAEELTTGYALIENYSQGYCSATVTNTLDYVITGFGDINVYGHPGNINKIEDTGEGELIVH